MPGKDIFLSYASEDRGRILPLARALEGTGWTVFWDRQIPTGKTWPEVLESEITTCRSVVVVWSEASVKSRWVRKEADEGDRRGVLFPVRIDEVAPPFECREIQAADLVRWDGLSSASSFQELVGSLRPVLDGDSTSTKAGRSGQAQQTAPGVEEEAEETARQKEKGRGPAAEEVARRAKEEPKSAGQAPRPRQALIWKLTLALAALASIVALVVYWPDSRPTPEPTPVTTIVPTAAHTTSWIGIRNDGYTRAKLIVRWKEGDEERHWDSPELVHGKSAHVEMKSNSRGILVKAQHFSWLRWRDVCIRRFEAPPDKIYIVNGTSCGEADW